MFCGRCQDHTVKEEKGSLHNDMWPIRHSYSKDPSAKITPHGLQLQTQDLNTVESLKKIIREKHWIW